MLVRPLTKLRLVTAVKTILDPAERTRIDKSGFPDTVVLVQISEADEMAALAPATVATASTEERGAAAAGAASSSTAAAAAIEVQAHDSDDEPATKKPKTSAPQHPTPAISAKPVASRAGSGEGSCGNSRTVRVHAVFALVFPLNERTNHEECRLELQTNTQRVHLPFCVGAYQWCVCLVACICAFGRFFVVKCLRVSYPF